MFDFKGSYILGHDKWRFQVLLGLSQMLLIWHWVLSRALNIPDSLASTADFYSTGIQFTGNGGYFLQQGIKVPISQWFFGIYHSCVSCLFNL
jgi:hypothetical protein